jgi:RNase H-fold protein (predicted Holliday junction resolvase)
MENYGDAMKYAQTSANSAGTAWEKYSTSYLNSIEAKTNALTAQFESLSQSVLDSDLVKGFVDLMTNVVKVLESILGIGDGVLLKITLFTASMAALYIALTRATAGIHKLSLKLSVMKASIATAAKETSVLNATLSALNINPVILAITAVTAVVVGLGVAFEAAEKKARENFEKIINNIEKSAEAISKFDDEIESLESLQSKLADAQGDHKKLASIYDELNRKVGASINLLKGEETAYAAVSLKLKDQIALTKKLREEELKNKINQARLGFESQTMKRSQNVPFIGQVDFAMPDLDASAMRKLMRSYGSTKSVEEVMDSIGGNVRGITHYQDIYKDIDYDMLYNSMSVDQQEHLLKDLGFTVDDWEKYWDTQVNIANEVFDDYIESSDPTIKGLLNGAVDRLIRGGFDLNETEEAIRELYASADVVQEYYDALASGDGASEAYAKVVDEFDALIQKYPELKDKIESFVSGISSADSNAGNNTKLQLRSVSEIIESVKDKYDLLTSASADMDNIGIISADNISKLLDEYPTLEKYVTKTKDGYILANDAIDDFITSIRDNYVSAVNSATRGTEDYDTAVENLYNAEVALATLTTAAAIEKQQKALEKSRDALDDELSRLEEIVDIRKQLLEAYKEEIDYRRELDKKQTAVSSLRMQLAAASLDNSAAGRAKARELRAELEEAEADLEDFTLEHAIDEITSRMDAEVDEYKKFIAKEVDRIETAINSLKETKDSYLEGVNGSPEVKGKNAYARDGSIWTNDPTHPGAMHNTPALRSEFFGPPDHRVDDSALGSFSSLPPGVSIGYPAVKWWQGDGSSSALVGDDSLNVSWQSGAIVEIHCDRIDQSTIPEIERIAKEAAKIVQRDIDKGIRRTGFQQQAIKFD